MKKQKWEAGMVATHFEPYSDARRPSEGSLVAIHERFGIGSHPRKPMGALAGILSAYTESGCSLQQ
jgi:hypothetical protein